MGKEYIFIFIVVIKIRNFQMTRMSIFNIALQEMGPKSVSLFIWKAFKKNVWLAVDFHVYKSMYALGWTNALRLQEINNSTILDKN